MNKKIAGEVFEIIAPSPGESISEVQIGRWLIKNGEFVKKNQIYLELESEKATLEMVAEQSGILHTFAKDGESVEVGKKIATITAADEASEPAASSEQAAATPAKTESKTPASSNSKGDIASVSAAKIIAENNLDKASIAGSGKDSRITKGDALQAASSGASTKAAAPAASIVIPAPASTGTRDEVRTPMSSLRKTISARLVAVKNQTAMLTTFNEVDLSAIMDIRKKYKDLFKEKHGIGLGFMSFFGKACCIALLEFEGVNGRIEGNDIVTNHFVDLGIAVSAKKGLMVPIIRNAEALSMAGIEATIANLAVKAREGKISLEDMSGGTFTITNGGVFGSMLSTPILNPPQSAILGMHNIVERAVVINKEIVIRPMMYLALSYDHRIVDGKDAVGFLVRVKNLLEDPSRLLIGV